MMLFEGQMPKIYKSFNKDARIIIAEGDSAKILKKVPDETFKLIITSPPYNLGKEYELESELDDYLTKLEPIVDQLYRILHPEGSL